MFTVLIGRAGLQIMSQVLCQTTSELQEIVTAALKIIKNI